MGSDWRQWNYEKWNERLLGYCLKLGQAAEPVERIPATPEELFQVVDDSDADPREVVEVFVTRAKECVPLNRLSFCGFCLDYRGWASKSPDPPHFFAMLWLTCLVAYGHPDNVDGFHDRMMRVFNRRMQMDCLPKLWSDLSEWVNEGGGRSRSLRNLRLPPIDDYRSDIGVSWFLAFPHQHDRRKLHDMLVSEDLIGEEPPIAPVVDALRRREAIFSRAFREDFAHFLEKFIADGGIARKSAFWRAVRQEALLPEYKEEQVGQARLSLLAYYEDEELVVYVACAAGAELPSGFSSVPLWVEIDGMSHYVLYEEGATPGSSPSDAAVIEMLERRVTIPRASLHIRRGVLVFQEALGGEYRLVSGVQANGASDAFVREDRREAFIRAYGGRAFPSRFPGWYQIVDCEVRVRRELPPGLQGAVHLQETMMPLPVRLVGGIRTAEGFLSFPGFLPRVRFEGATAVEIFDSEGQLAGEARLFDFETSEWELPDHLATSAPSRWLVRVRWNGEAGIERTSEEELVLTRAQVRHDYKRLALGVCNVEACAPADIEVASDTDVPIGLTAESFDGQGPDLVDLLPDARYLGPGLGEFSRTAEPGFDWLVVGPRNSPESLVFIGDPTAPIPPASRRVAARSEWRHWRKAVRNPTKNRRVFARLPDGCIIPLSELPAVESALKKYQQHDPSDCMQPREDVFTKEAEPPRWYGVAPDPRVADFVDALAALSVRRGGIRLTVLFDLLSGLLGSSLRANSALFFDLVRALVEAGTIDIAHVQGRRATCAIARRPAFVAYRVADRLRASLVGLTPALLATHVQGAVQAHGGRSEEIRPSCKWLPSVLRVECNAAATLRAISNDLNLGEPRWLRWPLLGQGKLDLRPDGQALRDGSPHESFIAEARWDWVHSKFISAQLDHGLEAEVMVERRSHRERCAIYVVLLNGEPWGWTFIRNWALLHAYTLKDGCAPFEANPLEPISRSSTNGVYLPLPLGRLCAVLGDGLSGPLIASDGISVKAYRYPIVYTFRERFGHLVPARSDTHKTSGST